MDFVRHKAWRSGQVYFNRLPLRVGLPFRALTLGCHWEYIALPMTTVCAIQNVPVEGLGLIASVLKASGITVKLVRPFKGDRVPPRLGRHSGLIVMGGPMSVHDQHQYPFLRDEMRLLEDALKQAKPVLGVCLGSQLLALALGAPVRKGERKEIGWHRMALTKAATEDELWGGLGPEFTAFHSPGGRSDVEGSGRFDTGGRFLESIRHTLGTGADPAQIIE